MKICFFILFQLTLLTDFVAISTMASPTNLATDQIALLTLKSSSASQDPHNILQRNWSSTSYISCCDWIGVTCGIRHNRVTSLQLAGMGLSGPIPAQLGNLTFLSILDLANNRFYGQLPIQLASLRRLKILRLLNNSLSGDFPPWLDQLPKLQFLSISINNFLGLIPRSISNLTNLEILQATNNKLRGQIPDEIGLLSKLRRLLLFGNRFSGTIPSSINNMTSLQNFDVSDNSISGSLPADMCSNLRMLEVLYLYRNQFYGQIPSLQNCTQLQKLSLLRNGFDGRISQEIGNLTRLEILGLAHNHFTGMIPQELANLHNLKDFQLHNNSLVGSIPSNIFNISTLEIISLSNNSLQGQLPSNIGLHLPNLRSVYLWANNLTGNIPESISNASQLSIVSLNNNSFTGDIPNTLNNLRLLQWFTVSVNYLSFDPTLFSSLSNCPQLRRIETSFNSYTGMLPNSIGNLSDSLEYFVIDNCGIQGHIPIEIGNLSTLMTLSLRQNQFTGLIPSSVRNLENLQYFEFSGNKLQGSIPHDICRLRSLVFLSFRGNALSEAIPPCIGNLTALLELRLSSNKLVSTIPSTLTSLKNIVVLDLSTNFLRGNIPFEIGNLNQASEIYLSKNHLSGNIPRSIGGLLSLATLSLAGNNLEGVIPSTFEDLIGLEILDLSENNISGPVPKFFEKLKYLRFFNVSSNRLQGEIPNMGPFANFSAESFKLNDELCGAERFQVPPCKNSTSSKSSGEIIDVLKYVLPSVVVILIGLVFIYIRYRKKNEIIPTQKGMEPIALRRISYQEIVQATDGFNEYNLLGKGSFGNVYKAIFSDSKIFAIKVFNLQLEGAFKSFDAECEVLRNIRHRNLVRIVTSCSNDHDFKALVLEYMPMGSLDKLLYSHNNFLDLMQRLEIMSDVAKALEYLHHGNSAPIVHCDLKPSNILLDDDMVAHVGDFGISKLLGEGEFMKQTSTFATIGYMAPEYGTEGIVSTNGDVYSYGIMLMEVLTRKKPNDEMFMENLSLKKWVSDSFNGHVKDIADSNLLGTGEEYLVKNEECLSSMLRLAWECAADSPKERISMKEVVMRLVKIKDMLQSVT